MLRSHRITTLALLALVGAAACGNKAEVARAKRSIYDTDFAIVYGKTLEATREIYDRTEDNPKSGAIKTAWHQVTYATNPEDVQGGRSLAAGATPVTNSPAAAQAGMPTRLAYKRYFVRFDVVVSGGRPWRVKVVGHASEWEPGAALPVELTGPARPPWLDGRTDALILAIHKKLRGFAVAMPEETPAPKPEDLIPRTDPTKFANVPSEAAKRMAQIKDAVVRREYPLLREQVFDDVVWNLGASPGIEIALATWQADPEALDAMARVIGEACAGSGKKVACPTAARPGQWQLVLEQRGEVWKVASFVRAE